jgi:formate dehydrogenase subunit gamma
MSISSRSATSTLPRFDRAERYAHWCTATLMLVLLFTGFSMYAGPLSQLVGRRLLMRTIHLYAGLLLPIPVLVAISLRAGAQLRADLGRLNRWTRDDRMWWSRRRRAGARLGKFNPGQKLNATFIGAAIVVMLMSGSILKWYSPFSDSWRQGATFVHDWFAIGLLFAIGGHIVLAFRDPDALEAMKRGSVDASWAEQHRPRWYAEIVGSDGGGAQDAISDVGARTPHDAAESGLRAREMTVVDPVHGRAGDGIGDREL